VARYEDSRRTTRHGTLVTAWPAAISVRAVVVPVAVCGDLNDDPTELKRREAEGQGHCRPQPLQPMLHDSLETIGDLGEDPRPAVSGVSGRRRAWNEFIAKRFCVAEQIFPFNFCQKILKSTPAVAHALLRHRCVSR
jgi:hypothetical protein